MDIATTVGFIASLSTILLSIYLGQSSAEFLNSSSALIVFMGTLTITLMKFPLSRFVSGFKSAGKAFYHRPSSNIDLIQEILRLSKLGRSGDLLKTQLSKIKNKALRKGIQLINDGFKQAEVQLVLERDLAIQIYEQNIGRELFKAIGRVAPAMGMIGTLVGLIQMLSNIQEPSSLGPAMAVALLTTLYGAVFAHAFALPVAVKLGYRIEEEIAQQALVLAGLKAIQNNTSSIVLEEILHSHLVRNEKK